MRSPPPSPSIPNPPVSDVQNQLPGRGEAIPSASSASTPTSNTHATKGLTNIKSTVSTVPSVRDDKSALDSAAGERMRDSPQPLSRQPTGNGSIRGGSALGSVKGEPKPSEEPSQPQPPQQSGHVNRSELDGGADNASVTGKPTRSRVDDAKSSRERAVLLEDADAQKKLNREAESGIPPKPVKSTASMSVSASLWSENSLPIPEGEFYCG